MLIDTHCHLHDEKFANERPEIINRAHEADVQAMISIGCDLATSEAAYSLTKEFPNIFYSAGIHPHEAATAPQDYLEKLALLATDKKCVAIGECGLDYYYNHSDKESQQRVFAEQIELAKKLKKALVVHVRDAWDDCLALLQENGQGLTIIIHCFSGPQDFAQECWKRGFYLSFSGIVTFKNAAELLEIAKNTPMDQLLLETDAPYLAPVPFRGKRNEPAWVQHVAAKIAEARGINIEELSQRTSTNAQKCFALQLSPS